MAAVLSFRPRLCRVLSTSLRGEIQQASFSDEQAHSRLKPGDPGVKPFKDIPGPKSLPIVGSFWRYLTGEFSLERIHHTYAKFYKDFGPIVRENMFLGRTLVHLFDPKDIEVVYKIEHKYYPIRVSHRAVGKYRKSRKNLYYHEGLGSSNGKEWKTFRRMFPSGFTREDGIDECSSILEVVADDLVTKIKSRLDDNNEVELLPLLYDWAMESMGAVTLGTRLGCLADNRNERLDHFISAVHDTHYAIYRTENVPFALYGKDYRTLTIAQDYIAHFLKPYIDQMYDENAKIDDGGELNVDSSQPISLTKSVAWKFVMRDIEQPNVLTMVIDMFQGGIHSTSHTLAFALYHLALNPTKQLALRDALIDALPNKTDLVSELPEKIKYCRQTIYETLRLNPPAIGTGRVLQEDMVLGGYLVPKNSICILQHQVAQMQEENYKNPKVFMPERFEKTPWSPHQFAFRPFAYGPRRCYGMGIALLELYLAVAKIMREFEVSYHHEKVDTKCFLINEPDKPIKICFKPLSK